MCGPPEKPEDEAALREELMICCLDSPQCCCTTCCVRCFEGCRKCPLTKVAQEHPRTCTNIDLVMGILLGALAIALIVLQPPNFDLITATGEERMQLCVPAADSKDLCAVRPGDACADEVTVVVVLGEKEGEALGPVTLSIGYLTIADMVAVVFIVCGVIAERTPLCTCIPWCRRSGCKPSWARAAFWFDVPGMGILWVLTLTATLGGLFVPERSIHVRNNLYAPRRDSYDPDGKYDVSACVRGDGTCDDYYALTEPSGGTATEVRVARSDCAAAAQFTDDLRAAALGMFSLSIPLLVVSTVSVCFTMNVACPYYAEHVTGETTKGPKRGPLTLVAVADEPNLLTAHKASGSSHGSHSSARAYTGGPPPHVGLHSF